MPAPTTSSLTKVTKLVTKKRTAKSAGAPYIHPNSRDHRRLTRASHRDQRLTTARTLRHAQTELRLTRIHELRLLLPYPARALSIAEMHELIATYIARHDADLAAARKARRPGRPADKSEQTLRLQRERDEEEYRSGFRMPDFSDEENVKRVVAWEGDEGGLGLVVFGRLARGGGRFVVEVKPAAAAKGKKPLVEGEGKKEEEGTQKADAVMEVDA